MKGIDSTYVAIGATWLVVGMILGIVMGAALAKLRHAAARSSVARRSVWRLVP